MGLSAQAALRFILRMSLIRGSESVSHPMPARRISFRAWGVLPTWKWVMLTSDELHKADYNHPKWV
jgi:hypothetical protein